MAVFERSDDFALCPPAVEQGQQIAIQGAVKQGIECLGNEQRLLFADYVKAQVRGKRGELDRALVGRCDSPQDTAPGTCFFHYSSGLASADCSGGGSFFRISSRISLLRLPMDESPAS